MVPQGRPRYRRRSSSGTVSAKSPSEDERITWWLGSSTLGGSDRALAVRHRVSRGWLPRVATAVPLLPGTFTVYLSSMHEVWRWWIPGINGKLHRSRWHMTEQQAQARYPGCKRVEGSRELREAVLPHGSGVRPAKKG